MVTNSRLVQMHLYNDQMTHISNDSHRPIPLTPLHKTKKSLFSFRILFLLVLFSLLLLLFESNFISILPFHRTFVAHATRRRRKENKLLSIIARQ